MVVLSPQQFQHVWCLGGLVDCWHTETQMFEKKNFMSLLAHNGSWSFNGFMTQYNNILIYSIYLSDTYQSEQRSKPYQYSVEFPPVAMTHPGRSLVSRQAFWDLQYRQHAASCSTALTYCLRTIKLPNLYIWTSSNPASPKAVWFLFTLEVGGRALTFKWMNSNFCRMQSNMYLCVIHMYTYICT